MIDARHEVCVCEMGENLFLLLPICKNERASLVYQFVDIWPLLSNDLSASIVAFMLLPCGCRFLKTLHMWMQVVLKAYRKIETSLGKRSFNMGLRDKSHDVQH